LHRKELSQSEKARVRVARRRMGGAVPRGGGGATS